MFGVLRPSSPVPAPRFIGPVTEGTPPPPRSLAAMSPSHFDTREGMLEAIKAFAADQGYAVVIARSRLHKLWLKCDRGGTYENRRKLPPSERKRKRGESRLLGCPFRMRARLKKDGLWYVETEITEHNHEASDDLSLHPSLRKMTDEQLAKVEQMCEAGNTPAETIEALRCIWPDIRVITRDIYNARKKYKTEKSSIMAGPQASLADIKQTIEQPSNIHNQNPAASLDTAVEHTGRWAWVVPGEETTSGQTGGKRGKTMKRHGAMPMMNHVLNAQNMVVNTTLDPQLHDQARNLHAEGSMTSLRYIPTSHNAATTASSVATAAAAAAAQDLAASGASVASLTSSLPDALGEQQQQEQFIHHLRNAVAQSSSLSVQDIHDATNAHLLAYPDHHHSHDHHQLHQMHQPIIGHHTNSMIDGSNNASDPVDDEGLLGSTSMTGGTSADGQFLMTRIERMEKEQLEQKNVLAQILGAVQGMRSSPPSS